MWGIEIITTRRRRQLELAESRLNLNGIRRALRLLEAEVQDVRRVHVESSTIPGGGYDLQEDEDETRRLDSLLIESRAARSYLGDDKPVTAEDLYGN